MEWERGGWEEGEQKNRRIRKESVADCFGPFLRRSFGLFSVDLSKEGVEGRNPCLY